MVFIQVIACNSSTFACAVNIESFDRQTIRTINLLKYEK